MTTESPPKQQEYDQLVLDVADAWRIRPHKVPVLARSFISDNPDKEPADYKGIPATAVDEFLMICLEHSLNPAKKEIAAFYSTKKGLTTFVMIDGWVSLANRHPKCDGWEFEYEYSDTNKLEAVTCIMYRKDRSHPTKTRVKMSEWRISGYDSQWNNRPEWMLTGKALKHGARFAFGFAGLYTDDEAREIQGYVVKSGQDDERKEQAKLEHQSQRSAGDILDQMEVSAPPPENEYRVPANTTETAEEMPANNGHLEEPHRTDDEDPDADVWDATDADVWDSIGDPEEPQVEEGPADHVAGEEDPPKKADLFDDGAVDYKKLGAWLRDKRKEAGITLSTLGQSVTDIKPTELSKIERGLAPNLVPILEKHILLQWADAIKVPRSELFEQFKRDINEKEE